jgi:outer membrane protein assembly factor BamB
LIVVVLLVVGGSIGLLSFTVNNRLAAVNETATTGSTNVRTSATANALVTTNTHVYATATTNGVMFGFNAQHTHFNSAEHILAPANVSQLVLDWTAPTGGIIDSEPTVANDIVYAGSYDHKLYAFNAATGATLWSASTDDVIYSGPTVANGVVYVGSRDHTLYAFHLRT